MKQLARYFLHGCLVLAPLAATLYILYLIFTTIDQLMPIGVPGLGFTLTLLIITAAGFLTSNVIGKTVVNTAEHLLKQVPLVKLVYTSLKDLVSAVVGDKRRFDSPVAVSILPGTEVRALGFVTRDSLEALDCPHHVAVYFPQSYNFAGNLLVVPRAQIEPLHVNPGDIMTFVVSGGVTGLGVGRTDEALLAPGESSTAEKQTDAGGGTDG